VYLDDVDHFLGFGLSLETIAERLGVRVDSIQQALRRREKREAGDQTHPAEQQRAVA
jgi:hypothetical protein